MPGKGMAMRQSRSFPAGNDFCAEGLRPSCPPGRLLANENPSERVDSEGFPHLGLPENRPGGRNQSSGLDRSRFPVEGTVDVEAVKALQRRPEHHRAIIREAKQSPRRCLNAWLARQPRCPSRGGWESAPTSPETWRWRTVHSFRPGKSIHESHLLPHASVAKADSEHDRVRPLL